MGPRLPRRSNNLPNLHVNLQIAIQNSERSGFETSGWPIWFPIISQPTGFSAWPKTDGNMQLIHHLSYTGNSSINDFIDPRAGGVQYSNIDHATEMIVLACRGAFEAKTDIISAFSLLPVILLLFGFRFQGKYYFDKMLSSVSSISCALFENFASFLHWLTQNYFQKQFYHSLYIFGGSPYSSNCHLSLQVIKFICSDSGDIARWLYPVARTARYFIVCFDQVAP